MSDSIDTIPTLREFLDAGCDLASIDRKSLVVLVEGLFLSAGLTPEMAAFDREMAQMVLDGKAPPPRIIEAHGESYCRRTHAMMLCWAAECAEHPELAERLEAALPADLRADLARQQEESSHPHRLLVESAEECMRTVCSACGSDLQGLVVTVDNADAVSYCAECITLAAEAVRVARGVPGGPRD